MEKLIKSKVVFGSTVSVASFSSVDPDITDSFEYSFVAGAGSTHNAFFSIEDDQLVLVKSLASYDDIPEYSIRLQSIDAAGGFVYKTFTFPVNHFPIDFLADTFH